MTYLITAAIGIVLIVVWLAIEQYDKDSRARKGLPPRKYHDVTDQDVTTVYTIHHHM